MTLVGSVDEISRARILGWAMNTEEPQGAVEIVVRINGREWILGVADRCRAGLKDHLGGDATGNYEFDIRLDPPLSVFQEYTIDVVVKGFRERLSGSKRKFTPPKVGSDRFTPIILTSTGRSGSTFLMQELARHPQIVAADRYPYEIKLIAYYSAAYRALVRGANRSNSTHPDTMLDDDHQYSIGHNPYNEIGLYSIVNDSEKIGDLFQDIIPTRYAEIFKSNIEDYYGVIKEENRKISAAFLLEKGNIEETAREGARLFFHNVKELVLVRDPRDMLCSAKAFWQLPHVEAVKMLASTLPQLEQIRKSDREDLLFLRYEDLLMSPTETRLALTRFIEIEPLAMAASNEDDASLSSHATSRGGRNSIDRWKDDLTVREIEECEELFGQYMDTFGYDRSGHARRSSSRIQLFLGTLAIERTKLNILEAGGAALSPLLNVAFGPDGAGDRYLGEGWYPIEDGFVWTSAHHSTIQFDKPAEHGPFRLRLVGRPIILEGQSPSQRLALTINGESFGEVRLNNFAVIEVELPDAMIAKHDRVTVGLECPDAVSPRAIDPKKSDDRVLGFALEKLIVFGLSDSAQIADEVPSSKTESAAAVSDEMPLEELMLRFESLGENCEFGLVQRRCNVDPLGLFRFSSTPLPKLLVALRSRFEGMGGDGSIEVQESSNGREYMVLDKRFGFLYHAWVMVGEQQPSEIEARETRRLPLLIRKLTEEMTLGEKIFIVRGMSPLSRDEALELSGALRVYGPTTLLWIEVADSGHKPGSVEWIEPGSLMKAYIDRFAPGENAHDLSLDCWVMLCRNAYKLWREA